MSAFNKIKALYKGGKKQFTRQQEEISSPEQKLGRELEPVGVGIDEKSLMCTGTLFHSFGPAWATLRGRRKLSTFSL